MSGAESPATSVLVVNHNAGPHLQECLERLSAVAGERGTQDGSLEIVLVDNASTDGSTEAVREFQAPVSDSAPPVRLIPLERNVGFGAGCNKAARHAAGRYLLLLNPDAWIDGPSLLLLEEALDADSPPRRRGAGPSLPGRPRPSLSGRLARASREKRSRGSATALRALHGTTVSCRSC